MRPHRYLHWREMAKQRKVMGGLMAQGLFGPMQVRIMGKRWLRKTRERLRRELEAKSALVIQRHFRGMQGIKRVRRIKQQRLVDACVSVQRAWRKKMECTISTVLLSFCARWSADANTGKTASSTNETSLTSMAPRRPP